MDSPSRSRAVCNGNRTEPGDLTQLVVAGNASFQGLEVDPDHAQVSDRSAGGTGLARLVVHGGDEGVEGVHGAFFAPALCSRLAELLVDLRLPDRLDAGARIDGAAHVEVPRSLTVDVAARAPGLADPLVRRLAIGIRRGSRAKTFGLELRQAAAGCLVHQPGLLCRRRRRRYGDECRLRARQLASTQRVFHHRELGELVRRGQHVSGGAHGGSGLGGQILRRGRVPRSLPLLDFVHTPRQQRRRGRHLASDLLELLVERDHRRRGHGVRIEGSNQSRHLGLHVVPALEHMFDCSKADEVCNPEIFRFRDAARCCDLAMALRTSRRSGSGDSRSALDGCQPVGGPRPVSSASQHRMRATRTARTSSTAQGTLSSQSTLFVFDCAAQSAVGFRCCYVKTL